ncbi:MAG: GNAT family N-acetyltransferase [Rhizobiaceae bacterium]
MRQVKKRNIRLETDRFVVRTLRESHASEVMAGWLADPELMENINQQPRRMSLIQLRRYILSYDQATRLLVGVFDAASEKHVGYYFIEINPAQRRATFNVVIGDRDYWGKRTVLETRAALMDYMFQYGAVEKLIGGPLARNFPAVFNYKAQGWKLEGLMKSHVLSASGSYRIDQYQFAMLKEDWRAIKSAGMQQNGMIDKEATA